MNIGIYGGKRLMDIGNGVRDFEFCLRVCVLSKLINKTNKSTKHLCTVAFVIVIRVLRQMHREAPGK